VPQGADLLSGSLRDNLDLGRAATPTLRARLRDVGLGAALAALPGGLDTDLAEDGAGLSGGQQQRLAIARALVGARGCCCSTNRPPRSTRRPSAT
jgi:ABC-type bacteriocin/lantibiotic exporter with double-glycine peptidase domain